MQMNNHLINQLHNIAQHYPEIQSILLFGSRAYGDYTDVSDIDLAVKAPGLSNMKWLLLTDQIENELDTLLKIDIVLYDESPEALRVQIDQCHEVLYQIE